VINVTITASTLTTNVLDITADDLDLDRDLDLEGELSVENSQFLCYTDARIETTYT